ncbi:MAG: GntR family transcriptional regulator, partial [Actinomycetota bacterium]
MSIGETHRPLRDVACDLIRDGIVSGQHPPGSRLVEEHLASELGVSRNPVREALRVLEAEGYVEMIPRRGAVVATLSASEASEIFEVRTALEALAARLAARKATGGDAAELDRLIAASQKALRKKDGRALSTLNTQFHQEVLRLAKNGYLRDVMMPLRGRMQWIFSHTALGDRGHHSTA